MVRSATTPPDVDAELAARLRLVITRLARRLRQQANEADVTPSQYSALSAVERLGPITLGDLSAVERVQPPSMTRIVAALEDLGLVEREVDARDRRVARVKITPIGQRLLNRTRSRKDLYLASRLNISPAERATLTEAAAILERVLESGE